MNGKLNVKTIIDFDHTPRLFSSVEQWSNLLLVI